MERHLPECREKDLLGLGRCLLSGAVPADFQFVDLRSHSQHPQPGPAVSSVGGKMIWMASFLRKPSGRPVSATAFPVPTCSACLSPAMILSSGSPAVLLCERASPAFLSMSSS